MSFVVIDVEASGLNVEQSYPIQIGWCRYPGILNRDHAEYLIHPVPQWRYWCHEAEQIHGISRQELELEGFSVEEVCNALNEALEGQEVISDGYLYDRLWLSRLFQESGRQQGFELKPLSAVIPDGAAYDLSILSRPHNALADARLVADFIAPWLSK